MRSSGRGSDACRSTAGGVALWSLPPAPATAVPPCWPSKPATWQCRSPQRLAIAHARSTTRCTLGAPASGAAAQSMAARKGAGGPCHLTMVARNGCCAHPADYAPQLLRAVLELGGAGGQPGASGCRGTPRAAGGDAGQGHACSAPPGARAPLAPRTTAHGRAAIACTWAKIQSNNTIGSEQAWSPGGGEGGRTRGAAAARREADAWLEAAAAVAVVTARLVAVAPAKHKPA